MNDALRVADPEQTLQSRIAEWERTLDRETEPKGERVPPLSPVCIDAPAHGLSCVLLAGGEGRRMGMPKAFLPVRGQHILTRIVERLRPICDEFIIVTGPRAGKSRLWSRPQNVVDPEDVRRLLLSAGSPADYWITPDYIPDMGPLGGIVTGLAAATRPWSFVVSCDAPFASARLARALLRHAEDADVVVPEWEGRLQPLLALYRQEAGRAALRRLRGKQLKLMELLIDPSLRVHTVPDREWAAAGIPPFTFMNLNTPQDLDEVGHILDHPENAELLDE